MSETELIKSDFDLTAYNTFGLHARAKYFAEYENLHQLRRIVQKPEYQESEVTHIGGGSNLLLDPYYDGLILRSAIKGITEYQKDDNTVYVIAGAAETWDDVVAYCVEHSLAGIENLSGIPGQVGGAAVQNIGAYGAEAADCIVRVECYDTHTGQVVSLTKDECRYGYRDSMFKQEGLGRYYILRVALSLTPGRAAKCLTYGPLRQLPGDTDIALVRETVLATRAAKLPDTALVGSAGSYFKNPVMPTEVYERLVLPQNPDVPCYDAGEGLKKVPAGWLVEHAGLKGAKVGGAEVWPHQCLVIANTGGATANDVKELAKLIADTVRTKFNVKLRPEVCPVSTAVDVTVLGTGTSRGIPEPACYCPVCTSADPRDKRNRTSVLVSVDGLELMIDASPDFRWQALAFGIDHIDAVLFTHSHYDHVGGVDDLRPYCEMAPLPLYMRPDVSDDLHKRIDYCFREHTYPGVPRFDIHTIGSNPFYINGVKIDPIEVMHAKLPIVGFRIRNFAYITDAKTIDTEEIEKLKGVDTLIVNALRDRPHFSHFCTAEALELIEKVKPRRAYLTHFSHEAGLHTDILAKLPEGVEPAYDGLHLRVD